MSLFHENDSPSFFLDDIKAWLKRRVGVCPFCNSFDLERVNPHTTLVPGPSMPPWNLDEYRWYRCTSCGLVDREERCGATLRWAMQPHWTADLEEKPDDRP